jgi:hypothetical protein
MQSRFEREIEMIENDESMTPQEKAREIRKIERDYCDAARESAERAYDDEMERW